MFEYWSKEGKKYCNNKLKSNSQYLYKNGFITLHFNLVGGNRKHCEFPMLNFSWILEHIAM